MLKGPIALQFGNELVVRDEWLIATLGNDREVVQVFEKFLVVANRKHNRRAVAMFVSEILQGLAHARKVTALVPGSRVRAESTQRKGWQRLRRGSLFIPELRSTFRSEGLNWLLGDRTCDHDDDVAGEFSPRSHES